MFSALLVFASAFISCEKSHTILIVDNLPEVEVIDENVVDETAKALIEVMMCRVSPLLFNLFNYDTRILHN